MMTKRQVVGPYPMYQKMSAYECCSVHASRPQGTNSLRFWQSESSLNRHYHKRSYDIFLTTFPDTKTGDPATQELAINPAACCPTQIADRLPPMIGKAGERPARLLVDFFVITIRNPSSREAYYRTVWRFMDWYDRRGLRRLDAVRPIHVAAYIEHLPLSGPLSGSIRPRSPSARRPAPPGRTRPC